MKRIHLIVLVVFALVVAACGGGETVDDTTTSTEPAPAVSSTTAADADGTGTTAAAVEASTTTVAATTEATTATGGGEAAGGGGVTLGAAVLPDVSSDDLVPGEFEATIRLVPGPGQSDVPEIEMRMEGAFDPATGNSRLFMDLGAIMEAASPADLEGLPPEMLEIFADPLEVITIGDVAYMKWGFFNMFLGVDGWIELPADETGSVTSEFGFGGDAGSPTQMLDQLRDANAEIEEVGREVVRGVETTHYRAVLDVETLAETLPPEERAELESQFGASGIDALPIDLWIGDDDLVYRYVIELDAAGVADMEELQSVSMTFEMFNYGEPVTIEPPDPSEVTSVEELGGFFGAGG